MALPLNKVAYRTLNDDDTFTNKREIILKLESENKIRVDHACEMNNNGKIVYITGIKLVIFSLIDLSSQVFIRKAAIKKTKENTSHSKDDRWLL